MFICIKFLSMFAFLFTSFFAKKIVHFSCKWRFVLFYKENNMLGGEMLTTTKWKQKLEFNIFLFMFSKKLNCNLVMHVSGCCQGYSYFVIATKVDQPICFHLGV